VKPQGTEETGTDRPAAPYARSPWAGAPASIQNLQGAVVLSGYQSELHDNALKGWRRVECQSRASAHRGTVLRTEVLWVRGPLTQSRS
jgi:hypothetical protein